MSVAPPPIQPGSRVRLHLRICLADGTEILSSFGGDPMELTLGDGTLAPGLEEQLKGLSAGADERFLADGSALFGPREEINIHWLERTSFPPAMDLASGQVVSFDAPGGEQIAGVVLEIGAERVQVDFNHPLAGRALQIRAHIISVSNSG